MSSFPILDPEFIQRMREIREEMLISIAVGRRDRINRLSAELQTANECNKIMRDALKKMSQSCGDGKTMQRLSSEALDAERSRRESA